MKWALRRAYHRHERWENRRIIESVERGRRVSRTRRLCIVGWKYWSWTDPRVDRLCQTGTPRA